MGQRGKKECAACGRSQGVRAHVCVQCNNPFPEKTPKSPTPSLAPPTKKVKQIINPIGRPPIPFPNTWTHTQLDVLKEWIVNMRESRLKQSEYLTNEALKIYLKESFVCRDAAYKFACDYIDNNVADESKRIEECAATPS